VVRRGAFTLIELIFAIVVIAVTVMSLPMMNQVLAKNTESSIIQEAIFAAATELNEATTAHWDVNSLEAGELYGLARVINVDSSCNSDQSSSRYRLRPGHILQSLHRRCLNDLSLGAADTTSSTIDVVENKAHGSQSIFLNANPEAQGYKNDYNSILTVSYDPPFAGASRSNMKKITSVITDSDGNAVVRLSTYVANIGETDYYKRRF